MKLRIDGEKVDYDRKEAKKRAEGHFPAPESDPFGFYNYSKDESVFTKLGIKIFQVPKGYEVLYKVGGDVIGPRPQRGAGYHIMFSFGGLWHSAHVINTETRTQDLIAENVLTLDNVSLNTVDLRLDYRVVDLARAVAANDYRRTTFGRAIKRVVEYVGNNTLEQLLESIESKETNLLYNYKKDKDGNVLEIKKVNFENLTKSVGVEIENLALVDIPLDDNPTLKEALAQGAIGQAEKVRRIHNADAAAYETKTIGNATIDIAEKLHNTPGGMEIRRLQALEKIGEAGNTIVYLPNRLSVDVNLGGRRSGEEENVPIFVQ